MYMYVYFSISIFTLCRLVEFGGGKRAGDLSDIDPGMLLVFSSVQS
jgi:hypothetical protein